MCDNHDVGKGIYGLQILVYVCSLLKITRPHIKNPLVYAAKASKRKCDKLLLKIQKLSLKAFKSKIKAGGLLYDLNSVILVSPKTALHLSARNGQWLYASTYIKHSQKKDKQKTCVAERWIELCICPNVPDDCCNISPILYHNLIQSNYDEELVIEFTNDMKYFLSSAFQKMIVLWQNCHKTELFSEEEVKFESGPQYAAEVHIKYVESLQYKCGTQLDALINDYFSIPKAVTLNDILLIPIPNHLEHEFANNNSIVPPRYIFIEICSVKGKTGNEIHQTVLLSKGATNLYLGGATRRPFPCLSEVVNSKGEISVPPILAKNVENLASDFRNDFNFIQEEKDQCNKEMQICKSCEQKCELGDLLISKKTSEKDLNSMKFESKDIVRPSVLYLAPPGSGAEEIISIAASRLGSEVVWIDCWHLKGDTSGATEGRLRQSFHRASVQSPCVLALLNVHCLAKDNDGNDDSRVVAVLKEEVLKLHNLNVFLVATAPDSSKVSADLWSIWSHQETIEVPDLVVRSHMLDWLFSHWITKAQIQIIAQRTAGCVYGDFQALLAAAKRVCLHRLSHEQEVKPSKDISCNHSDILPISFEDVLEALNELQSSRSEALGAPRIPQVQWKDVGGLEDAKREVVNTIQLPLRHPSLVSSGLRRSGVLLYGPPGTGKTLLAKAVATECGLNFMSVKGPELLNMYVGQSEENVRQVFARARTAAPCVIFFDELDSLAPNRGHSGDSGGVMDRIVSALLVELDGAASSSDVFVLAATNRPDLLDPALLRPGRFEKLVFLGACDDRDAQVKILQAVTSKVPLAEDIDLTNVADMLPSALTGADLYALCSDALYVALERTTECIMSGMLDEQDADVLIQENDFRVAANQLVPSVSVQELVHYRNMSTNERSRRE